MQQDALTLANAARERLVTAEQLARTADEVLACDRLRGPLVLQCVLDHHAGKRLPLDAAYTHASVFAPDPAIATAEPAEPPTGTPPPC